MVHSAYFATNHDPGNPCRGLRDQTCSWLFDNRNSHFEDLQRNRFNISCKCDKEREGFVWESKYHLCVDLDECLDKNIRKKCSDKGRRCVNKPGGYRCFCHPGYVYDHKTLLCEQRVQILRPFINQTLLEARYLRKMLQPEGAGPEASPPLQVWLGSGDTEGTYLLGFLHYVSVADHSGIKNCW
ncbi:hypothetical protein ACOMHN_043495 [Nucella lapillus]